MCDPVDPTSVLAVLGPGYNSLFLLLNCVPTFEIHWQDIQPLPWHWHQKKALFKITLILVHNCHEAILFVSHCGGLLIIQASHVQN